MNNTQKFLTTLLRVFCLLSIFMSTILATSAFLFQDFKVAIFSGIGISVFIFIFCWANKN